MKGRINWVTVINVPIFNRVYVATNDPNLEASFYANIDCEARKERSSITMATAYTNQYFGVYRQYAAAATWSHEMVHVIMAWLKRNEVSCRETPAYLMEYLMAAHSVLESALKKNTRVDHDHARLVWVRRYPAGVQALKAAQRFVKENALYVETFKGKTIHWKQTVRPLKGGHDK